MILEKQMYVTIGSPLHFSGVIQPSIWIPPPVTEVSPWPCFTNPDGQCIAGAGRSGDDNGNQGLD